jgi:hypothetical protein
MWFSIHTKDFCEKNDPNLLDFDFFFNQWNSTTGGQNIIEFKKKKKLSHMLYSQILLNCFVDNHQFALVLFFWYKILPNCEKKY